MSKYTIGVDFGTLSGRAVLVDVQSGAEVASATFDYPHGVMDKALPDGTPLGVDWALQHPQDYLDVYTHTIPKVLQESGVNPADVIGIGIDFTACTWMPIKKDGTPMCFLPEYAGEPNAYVKLWKHHAAQDKANRLNEIAAERGEAWLSRYGGKISSEWQIPKTWQVLDESPEIYAATDHFIEAADWAVWALCGNITKNTCTAGYKGQWNKRDGYPSNEFFAALDPRLENYVQEKLDYPLVDLGAKAGGLTEAMAQKLGLPAGIAIAAGNVDAHVTVPAVKVDGPGKMVAIMGTSTCHMLLAKSENMVQGMCGVVDGGIYPEYYGYEAGQSCVGDHFAWFVENCVPAAYQDAAKAKNVSIHDYLTNLAAKLAPGESGLVALDWWNGNRSILVDVDLTGLMLGMTLQTTPEEMYRALIEATAYGTRKIIDAFRDSGVEVDEFIASGGISQKNPLMMQIYADVLNMPVRIADTTQGGCLGSAMHAAVAAGEAAGGYANILDAAMAMGKLREDYYSPNPQSVSVYAKLYAEYVLLHDYFGRGANDAMKRLKQIRKEIVE